MKTKEELQQAFEELLNKPGLSQKDRLEAYGTALHSFVKDREDLATILIVGIDKGDVGDWHSRAFVNVEHYMLGLFMVDSNVQRIVKEMVNAYNTMQMVMPGMFVEEETQNI